MLGGNKGQDRVRCSCWMCSPGKRQGNGKERFKHSDYLKRLVAREQIEER